MNSSQKKSAIFSSVEKVAVIRGKRLAAAADLVTDSTSPVYDLFCDHGILGEYFFRKTETYFNEIQEDCLEKIQARLNCSRDHLLLSPAKDISIKENSFVFMMGIGGHTITECFEYWSENNRKNFEKGQTFILSPHIHLIEMVSKLEKIGLNCLTRKFIWEKGQGYEIFCCSYKSDDQKGCFEAFEENFWSDLCATDCHAKKFLKYRMKFLNSYRGSNAAIIEYRTKLRSFVN